jgi:2-polyprenyl-3-methyl-5-hydroxy-6-metoxy-1,4-benzoquinol methylase
MKYTKEHLENHELNYWFNTQDPNRDIKHLKFYQEIFNFDLLEEKKVIDVGCGGTPVTNYTTKNFDLTILDPIIDKLTDNDRYKHLLEYKNFSGSILDYNETNFDVLVCLNVIDHFEDPEAIFIDKFKEILKPNGELWLYYDVRDENSDDHLKLDNEFILNKIQKYFTIEKISESINPKHIGWSKIKKSIRLIAKKK